MTLRDLENSRVIIQGHIKLQCWGDSDYPVIYFEGDADSNLSIIKKYYDREIVYMFPYITYIGKHPIASICIEFK